MRIRFAVFALFEYQNRFLMYKAIDSYSKILYYRPIGGGVEFGEYSIDAIRRELSEEISAEIIVKKDFCFFESVFHFENQTRHEIYKGYLADFVNKEFYKKKSIRGIEPDGERYEAEWIELADLLNANTNIYPNGLKDLLVERYSNNNVYQKQILKEEPAINNKYT